MIPVNVKANATTESIFFLAIISSILIGSLMLILMYFAIKGVVLRQTMLMKTQIRKPNNNNSNNESETILPIWNRRNDDEEYDDYGTFGRRLQVFGKFTGSMASLHDASDLSTEDIIIQQCPTQQKHNNVNNFSSSSLTSSSARTNIDSINDNDHDNDNDNEDFISQSLPSPQDQQRFRDEHRAEVNRLFSEAIYLG